MKNLKPKLGLKLLLISLLSFLVNCASIPDVPIATEISPDRGYFVHIMSGKSYEVNETNKFEGKTYWEMRPSMIHMPASSWAEIKKWIIKTCKRNPNQCDKSVSSWERTVETIDQNIESRLP